MAARTSVEPVATPLGAPPLITPAELAAHTLFAPLDPAQIDLVASRMLEMHVPAGVQLAKQGDFGMRLFIVFTGTAEVRQQGASIATLSDGNVFGEIGIADGRRTADVIATTPMRLGALNRWDVEDLSELIPVLGQRLTKVATVRRERDRR